AGGDERQDYGTQGYHGGDGDPDGAGGEVADEQRAQDDDAGAERRRVGHRLGGAAQRAHVVAPRDGLAEEQAQHHQARDQRHQRHGNHDQGVAGEADAEEVGEDDVDEVGDHERQAGGDGDEAGGDD